ncbi:Outer membrane pore protein E precursor [Raoultella ornithinolytica]|nr:Outer membrane pore protein E precursor [Raoultella ornithinolytica]
MVVTMVWFMTRRVTPICWSNGGGDGLVATDNFMTARTNGVATYRNSDFFGLVDGLTIALQYQGKNNNRDRLKANGDGYSTSVDYNIDGFGFAAAYSNSDRTDEQAADRKGETAEVWSLAAKYDANSLYRAVMYAESHNMTPWKMAFSPTKRRISSRCSVPV